MEPFDCYSGDCVVRQPVKERSAELAWDGKTRESLKRQEPSWPNKEFVSQSNAKGKKSCCVVWWLEVHENPNPRVGSIRSDQL